MMNRDYLLIFIECIVTIYLLIRFIPKDRIREAHVLYLFNMGITWIQSLIVSELRLIKYPVRLFSYSNKTSFHFEFLVFPSVAAIFNINYPEEKSTFSQFMYYFYYCSSMTVLEVFTERYTNILTYIHWTWYITWITLFITLQITHSYYLWFFKLKHNNS